MTLRRKILLSFILLTIVSGLVTLLILETAYISGDSFQPGKSAVIAPGLWMVAASMVFGMIFVAYLLFLTLRRLVLDPIDDIIHASEMLTAGEVVRVQSALRRDEIGKLAHSFNVMAEKVAESRQNLEGKVRAATEKIETTQRELAFAERLAATGRLAAGVAHEINNPLGGVMNAVARLRKGSLTPEREAKYFDICDDGLRRIQETVRRILDFSRKRPEMGPVRVVDPLMQSVELVRHLLEPAGVRLELHIPEDSGDPGFLRVMADPGDLQHVFLNLLVNAVDAMPNGGVLTITVSQAMKWVLVEIRDTGVGLTLEELSASFDYFHTTKPVGKGTGLGLSIAHHIVVGYHGALTLNSQKGVGTRATVELPALDARRTAVVAGGARRFANTGGQTT